MTQSTSGTNECANAAQAHGHEHDGACEIFDPWVRYSFSFLINIKILNENQKCTHNSSNTSLVNSAKVSVSKGGKPNGAAHMFQGMQLNLFDAIVRFECVCVFFWKKGTLKSKKNTANTISSFTR